MTANYPDCLDDSWLRHDGGWVENQDIVYQWDLDSFSVVFEIGGYEGAWADEIASRFNPFIWWFEPNPGAYQRAKGRIAHHPRIKMYNMGLGDRDGVFTLGGGDRDGASFTRSDEPVQAQMIDIAPFLQSNGIQRIDLMQINIEGGEFLLLPYLINSGIIQRIKWLQIQWHVDWNEPTGIQGVGIRDRIRYKMTDTHEMLWNIHAWEAWQRKDDK
jgi:FkbM family methyltransferase